MKFSNIQIGTDSELFLRNSNGKPIPAIGLVGGTKLEPLPVLGGGGFSVQEDNVMVEFNVPPANNKKQWIDQIETMIHYLDKTMKAKDLWLDFSPSMFFNPEELLHPQAQHMGCEPDFCAWTQTMNPAPYSGLLEVMRSSGGHIHTSYLVDGKAPMIRHKEMMVKAEDLFLGVPSILMDKDPHRRQLYGKAGAFRPKNVKDHGYDGHEYRVLSNFWVRDPLYRGWVYDNLMQAFDFVSNWKMPKPLQEQIQKTINTQDTQLAEALVKQFNIAVI